MWQTRTQPLKTRQRHAIGVEIEADARAFEAARGEARRQHRDWILPVAIGRHIGDPGALATWPGIECADQKERIVALVRGHNDAAPAVLRVAIARNPGHCLDRVEQRSLYIKGLQPFTQSSQPPREFRRREMRMSFIHSLAPIAS